MKLRKTGRIAIAGLAVVAALGMTACSDDKDDKPAAKSTTSQQATTTPGGTNANTPPPPTVAELNQALQKALDPSVPNSEKLELVQGAEADPELPNRLAEAAQAAGVQVEVTSVDAYGDAVNATAKFVLNGQENNVAVPFVLDGGKWKVEKKWACQMLTTLGQQSTACAA